MLSFAGVCSGVSVCVWNVPHSHGSDVRRRAAGTARAGRGPGAARAHSSFMGSQGCYVLVCVSGLYSLYSLYSIRYNTVFTSHSDTLYSVFTI